MSLFDVLKISDRPLSESSIPLDQARAEAQKVADENQVDVVLGWQINDADGCKEYGWCPAAAADLLVIEPIETIKPYTAGRADFAQRQDRRRDRLKNAAAAARAESSRRVKASDALVAHIPMGQPILVGHHSEKRHRRTLERSRNHMFAAIAADKRANALDRRAESVGDGGISSDDPEALSKLREELVAMNALQDMMKSANHLIRKHAAAGVEAQVAALLEIGIGEDRARNMLRPDFAGRIGFPDYRLKNNGANIRRVQKRIETLTAVSQVPEGELARSRAGVVLRVGDNRVQIVFDGKPPEHVRARLKSSGFRWAPSNGAWQRHLNNAGAHAGREVIRWLDSLQPDQGPAGE